MRTRSDDAEFWSRVDVLEVRDCWHWNGTRQNAYGVFHVSSTGASVAAHRYAWSFAYGAIPTGSLILHSCDNTRCVNPRHLRSGSSEDNGRDKTVLSRVRSVMFEGEAADRLAEEALRNFVEPRAPKLPSGFGGAIRRARLSTGLNQRDFAELVGVSPATISSWESGVYGATLARLSSIAKTLNIEITELLA